MLGTLPALRFALAAVFATAAASCSASEQGVTQAQTGEPVIVLSEGECAQTCPVYDMNLYPSGAYRLNGVKFVKTPGVSEGRLGKKAWDEAEKVLNDASFWTLPPDQTIKMSENCQSGAPTVNITWRTEAGKRKTVTYTAGCGGVETRDLVIKLREAMAFGDLVWTEDRFSPDGSR